MARTTLSVPFTFPNTMLTSDDIGLRAYKCLARVNVLDSDTLIEIYPNLKTTRLQNFGANSYHKVTEFLINSQVSYLQKKGHLSREDAELEFLRSIVAANPA